VGEIEIERDAERDVQRREEKKKRRNGFSAMGLYKVKSLVFLCYFVIPVVYGARKSSGSLKISLRSKFRKKWSWVCFD